MTHFTNPPSPHKHQQKHFHTPFSQSTTFLINPTSTVSLDFNYNIAFLNKASFVFFRTRMKTLFQETKTEYERFFPILICDITCMNVHDWKKNKRIQKPWQKVIIFYDWRKCMRPKSGRVWGWMYTSGVQRQKKTYFRLPLILGMRLFNVNTCKERKKALAEEAKKMGRNFNYSWPSLIHSFILYRTYHR